MKKYYIKLVDDADDVRALFIEDEDGCVYQAADVDAYTEKVEKLKEAAEGVLREVMLGKLLNVTDMQHVFAALAALEEENG